MPCARLKYAVTCSFGLRIARFQARKVDRGGLGGAQEGRRKGAVLSSVSAAIQIQFLKFRNGLDSALLLSTVFVDLAPCLRRLTIPAYIEE